MMKLHPHLQRNMNYDRPKSQGWIQVNSDRYVFLFIDGISYMLCRDSGWYTVCFAARQHAIGHDSTLRLYPPTDKSRNTFETTIMNVCKLALDGHAEAAKSLFTTARAEQYARLWAA